MKKVVALLIVLALTFMAITAALIATGHASTTSGNRPNSLGISETYQNPYTYLLALPMDGQILEGRYTNIRLWPFGTPALYAFSILFCGDVTEKFEGKSGVLVLTYETRAHAMYKGVACQELLGVSEVKAN